jgi:hypothetical protein
VSSFCGLFEERVYSKSPRSLEDFKHNVGQALASIDQQTLREVATNTVERANACLEEDGGHFWHWL